jgi:hypothetical protein
MTSEDEFWGAVILTAIIFAIAWIWLIWYWALLVAVGIVWGGIFIIDGGMFR